MKKTKRQLTPKQERFCQEYIVDLNATQAYIRAGYKPKGARANSTRTIAIDSIQARIAELGKKYASEVGVTCKMVLDRLKKKAFSNIIDFIEVKGNDVLLKDLGEKDRELTESLASLKVHRGDNEVVEIKMKDDGPALDKLMRYLGMFEKDNKLDVSLHLNKLYDKLIDGAEVGIPKHKK